VGKSKLRKKIRQEIMALILENKTATEIMIAVKERYNFDVPLTTVKHYQKVNKETGWRGEAETPLEIPAPSNNGDINKELLRVVLEMRREIWEVKEFMRQDLIKSRAEALAKQKKKKSKVVEAKKQEKILPVEKKSKVIPEEEMQKEFDDLIDKQIEEKRKKELERLIKEQRRDDN